MKRSLFFRTAILLVLLLSSCATNRERRWDPSVTVELPPPTEDARGIIIIAHGANSGADKWPLHYYNRIQELPNAGLWDIVRINWPSLANRYLTAAGNGLYLGQLLGRDLAQHGRQYEIIHLVGQSLGAHIVHGIAGTYREQLAGQPQAIIHTTLIDPFMPMGIFDPYYGRTRFGIHADFAECYFTRDEPVWFSNTPMVHAVNFDLSEVVPPRENPYFTYYHDYPVLYYQYSIGNALGPGFALSPIAQAALEQQSSYDVAVLRNLLPPGSVIQLSPRGRASR
jgi:pimeloyl-ACP methyl ester carboxylesterase